MLTASAAFAAGLQFQALITLNNEGYVPLRWQGMLFYWMVLLYSAAVNIWGSRVLPHTNLASGSSIEYPEDDIEPELIHHRHTPSRGTGSHHGSSGSHGSKT